MVKTEKILFKKVVSLIVTVFFVSAIVLYSYPLIKLWGQIKPTEYPKSYEQTNLYLTQQNITGHIIYLPWEQYLTYNWTIGKTPDGRIAVPINNLVKPIIETSSGLWGAQTDLKTNISNCLNKQSISCLEDQGVQYILHDKCAFYPYDYAWINKSVHDDSCITIHKLNNSKIIDRTIKPPLRFIIGSAISLVTLISMIVYLIVKRK